jgi:PBP1b-binding outer membrane lipoprotein LpoB
MKTKIYVVLLIVAFTLILTGCAKYPENEVQKAQNALESARSAGAEMYVKDQFNTLQDSLNNVLLGLEQQKSKWFPNYEESLAHLTSINAMAESVVTKTELRKSEIRDEIQNTLVQIQNLLAENNQLIANAPKGKEGTEALNQIKEELSVVQTAVDEAGKMLDSGELLATQDKVNTAHQKAAAINAELKDVIDKYNQARGRRG